MNTNDFIPESEAAAFTGVSANTLDRFVEAGYLRVENDNGGGRLYSTSELRVVFGLDAFEEGKKVTRVKDASWQSIVPSASLESNRKIEISRKIVEVNPASATSVGLLAHPRDTELDLAVQKKADPALQAGPLTQQIEVINIPAQKPAKELNEIYEPEPRTQIHDQPQIQEDLIQNTSAHQTRLQSEVAMLKELVNQREKQDQIQHERIKLLEEQNSWLKTRIEHYEEKAERDQLLLLAEAQTVRRLITIQEKRKSPWRAALEWLGLALPAPETESTIEIGHQASQQENDQQKSPT